MKKILLLGMSCLMLSSCALMFQGSKKSVTIKSSPPGSSIYVDGEKKGTDLVTEKLSRKKNHSIVVKKEGYVNQSVEVKKHVQVGWIIFDSLFNWLAFTTDPTTGAWNTFDKDNFIIELERETENKSNP